jgi:biopolymer transport protein ExbD
MHRLGSQEDREMSFRIASRNADAKVEIPMTPMIDIVFQLLVFFIFTMKVGGQEGDFNVKMPQAAPRVGLPDESMLPMKIHLRAGVDGELVQIALNDMDFGVSFEKLHQKILSLIGDERGPGSNQETAEVELECDYNLRYEYVMHCITAVSGYVDAHGNVVKLVEKLKFSPPREPNLNSPT